MTWLIVLSVAAGIVFGFLALPEGAVPFLDVVSTGALCVLLFGVGLDLGQSKEAVSQIKSMGWKIICVPLLVAVGSLVGALAAGTLLGLPLNESTAVGAGFGWYSLSGVLIAKIYSVEIGALAFLTNVIREIMACLLIPVLAVKLGKLAAVAPGGATTMDTTLPLISRFTDTHTTVVAFVSGAVLSALVPLLVPILITL